MSRSLRSLSLLCVVATWTACSSGGGGGGTTVPADAGQLALAVNTTVLTPDATAALPAVDRQRLGIGRVAAIYRLTTPANTPFGFDLVAWQDGSRGSARVAVAHAADGGEAPRGGIDSLAAAGLVPSGAGVSGGDGWLQASGDGIARLTLQGAIERPQVLAVTGATGDAVLVEIAIGEPSVINQADAVLPTNPAVTSRDTVYSSDAWCFGLPTIAVSGDRTSIVAYEGDRQTPMDPTRYELRLQHQRSTGAVTGGGTRSTSFDSGSWRDHEIAALYNVLAVVRSEPEQARVLLSFDRGATFAQEVPLGQGLDQTRLPQLAMALDYSLAVVYWQTASDGRLQLWLAEALPLSFDAFGSPTWFQFDAPQLLRTLPAASTPLTSGVAFSSGGDLVIGYGASTWNEVEVGWASTTEFRCATRRWGEQFRDVEVDLETMYGRDPSVSVLGEGATLRIFYAYEVSTGVRLAVSSDGGATFAYEAPFGTPGAHLPSVFARQRGADTQVDVLYLAAAANGLELHQARWATFGTAPRADYRVTTATMTRTPAQAGRAIWNGSTPPFDYGWRTKQVSWLGYDAALDGDQIVVAVDEVTQDAAYVCLGLFPQSGRSQTLGGPMQGQFLSAYPPPLAPGMTQPLPPVVPTHAHQLQLVRID